MGRESGTTFVSIEEGKRGLLCLDGRPTRELGPGTYGFRNTIAMPRIEALKTRRQLVAVSRQEVLSQNKVAVRVNISAVFEIALKDIILPGHIREILNQVVPPRRRRRRPT